MNQIRKYRLKAGISQKELAKGIKKTAGCVSQYESGIHIPPVPVAKRIAKIVGCNWADLYEDEDHGKALEGC